MRFSCLSCSAKYQVADEKVGGKTIRMKCRKCGATLCVRPRPDGEGEHVADSNVAPVSMAPENADSTRSVQAGSESVPNSVEAAEPPSPPAPQPASTPSAPLSKPPVAAALPGLPPASLGAPLSGRPSSIPLPGAPRAALPSFPTSGMPIAPPRLPSLPSLPALPGGPLSPFAPGAPPRLGAVMEAAQPAAPPAEGREPSSLSPAAANVEPPGGLFEAIALSSDATVRLADLNEATVVVPRPALASQGEPPGLQRADVESATVRIDAETHPASDPGRWAPPSSLPIAGVPSPIVSDPLALTRMKAESARTSASPDSGMTASDPLFGLEMAASRPDSGARLFDEEAPTVAMDASAGSSGPAAVEVPPADLAPDLVVPPGAVAAPPADGGAGTDGAAASGEGASTLLSAEDRPSSGFAKAVADIRLEVAGESSSGSPAQAAAIAEPSRELGAEAKDSTQDSSLEMAAMAAPTPIPGATVPAEVGADFELEALGDRERRQRSRGLHPMAWGFIAMCAALGGVAAWVFLGSPPPKPDSGKPGSSGELATQGTNAPSADLVGSAPSASSTALPASSAEAGTEPAASGEAVQPALAMNSNAPPLSGFGPSNPTPQASAAATDKASSTKGADAPCDPRTDPFCSSVGGPDGGSGGPGKGGSSAALTPEQISSVIGRNASSVQRACIPLVQNGAVKVTVSMTIGPAGNVTSVSTSGGGNNGSVVSCIRSRVSGWTFPSSGGSSSVSVPFQLIAQN